MAEKMKERELRRVLAGNVYTLRSRREWSQEDLASRCGINQRTVANIESVNFSPKFVTVYRISRALGVGIERLLFRV